MSSVAFCFNASWRLPRSFFRAGHLKAVNRYQSLRMRVYRQHAVFQGRGAEEVLLPVLSEGYRSGELLTFESYYGPSSGPFHVATVGEFGSIVALGKYTQACQKLPCSLGERRSGYHQQFHFFQAVALRVGYINCDSKSPRSCYLLRAGCFPKSACASVFVSQPT